MRKELEEIVGHLGAALRQQAPSDDKIIMDHVRKAYDSARQIMNDPAYCAACGEYMPPHAPHMCPNWPPKKDQGNQSNEQKIARIIFEQINNCSIRDQDTQFNEGSGPLRAAQAVLAAWRGPKP